MRRRLVALMFTLTLVVGACGGTAEESSTTLPSTSTTSTATSSSTTTTTVPPTTTIAPTTTTVPPTTTTTAPSPEVVMVSTVATFEERRDTFIGALTEIGTVQSVDRFVMEAADENDALSVRLVVDITSEYSTTEYRADQAWELTRTLAILWEEDNFYGSYADIWAPGMLLVVSGQEYACPAELMLELADARASRSAWEEAC